LVDALMAPRPPRQNPTPEDTPAVQIQPLHVVAALRYLGLTDAEIGFLFNGFNGTGEQAILRFPSTFRGYDGYTITQTQVRGMARQAAQGRGGPVEGAQARRAEDAASTAPPARPPLNEDDNARQAFPDGTVQTTGAIDLGMNGYGSIGGLGGGGGGTGFSGMPGASNQRTPPQTPEELDAYLRANYGYLAGFLAHPEIGPLLRQAATEGWDQNRLLGALSGTQWWKTSTEASRQWEAQQQLDPGQAADTRNGAANNVRALASQFGIAISEDRLKQLAEDSIKWGWSEGELTQAIAAEAKFGQTGAGTITASVNDLKAEARRWLTPMSDETLFKWAQNIASGAQTVDGFRSYVQQVAQQRFPDLAEQMQSGVAPGDYFAPYAQTIAQTLEIPTAEIDFNDTRWQPVIDFVDDKGTRRPMTNYEVSQWAMTQPEYDQTSGAVSNAYSFGDNLGRMFGRVA
jgi:hypothetical protein